ncbi:heavy metal sensor histidine kinase [Massilia niastensis]|uniref:heavy metal sensor histidine kinase n=1 Tax=Massilia niastensis TaxID=544911 RepID=UPI000365F7FD|nr:heavy metal sensor histidine kinase [Massilia niastensis]
MKRRKPLPIALRLALLFSAIAVMVFVGVGAYLYQALAAQLLQHDDAELLHRYAGTLVIAVAVGAGLATVLGFVIVRRGLRPLHDVISKANDISAHRLKTRLSVDAVPAELREAGVALNAMLDRLEEGVQRLSGFAADLAHDMRTPINNLMVETQVALSRPRNVEEYQALLASNLEEYDRLSRMIENTLFLARADNAQVRLDREMLDAHAELQRIRDYFEILAEEAGVVLELAPAEPGGSQVYAEPILFQRAVSNLMSNAIAHTPEGGRVSLAVASAAPPGAESETVITISNTGAGIPSDRLERIFDRYYRGDETRFACGYSTGLGLAIVRAIMNLHAGSVAADSQPGRLTTFTLRFPLVPERVAGQRRIV